VKGACQTLYYRFIIIIIICETSMRYEIQLERMRSDAMQLGYLHGFKLRAKSTIQANFRSINSKPLILSAINLSTQK